MLFKILILFLTLVSTFSNTNAVALRSATNKIYFGGALAADHITSDENYRKLAAEEVNCLTPEWEMKWNPIEGQRNHFTYQLADKLVEFAKTNNIKVRGHALLWHQEVPQWVNGLSKAELESAVKKHINDTITHFKGKIYAWDVLNEIFNDDGTNRDSVFHKNFGMKYVSDAFKDAHAVDPTVKLYINDYSTEGKNKKSDALYNLVKQFKSDGVPVHGVGFQAHFLSGQVPQDMESNMKRFADLGLDVAVTELDIRIDLPPTEAKLQQQAKDYAFVVKSCLNIPTCVGVTFWGITDKYSWVPGFFKGQGDALPFDANYKPKPAVAAMLAALK